MFTFDQNIGIIIGNLTASFSILEITVHAKKPNTNQMQVVQTYDMNIEAVVNSTMKNFKLHTTILNITV
jgi:hypothetical protein